MFSGKANFLNFRIMQRLLHQKNWKQGVETVVSNSIKSPKCEILSQIVKGDSGHFWDLIRKQENPQWKMARCRPVWEGAEENG